MNTQDFNLTQQDISVLKYYKEGNELCGFERVHTNLCNHDYLDGDLYLTNKAHNFINNKKDWDKVEIFNNKTKITIK